MPTRSSLSPAQSGAFAVTLTFIEVGIVFGLLLGVAPEIRLELNDGRFVEDAEALEEQLGAVPIGLHRIRRR